MYIKYPFFGSVLANVEFKETKELKTAGTDNKTIYYNPQFLSESSESKQVFVLAHEVCHIGFNHVLRSEGKDKGKWNIATDAVINALLKQDGLEMPDDGVNEEYLQKKGFNVSNLANYTAEELYEELLKQQEGKKQEQQQKGQQQASQQNGQSSEPQEQESEGQSSDGQPQQNSGQSKDAQNDNDGKSSSGGQEGLEGGESEKDKEQGSSGSGGEESQDIDDDTHDLWEEAIKRQAQEKTKADEEQSGDDKKDDKLKETQDELTEMGEKEAFKKNKETRKEQLEKLIDALSKESKGAGNTTNSETRKISDIGTSKPLLDWRLMLREALSMDVDWSYQNAEVENGVVRPNLETYPIPETEIILDTSDSINENLLKNFLRECKNILQASRVKVGCFDTEFYGFTEIKTLKDIDNFKCVGGGGTNFNVPVNAFSKRVENKLIFTDGDAPMPRTQINAIWIVFGGKEIKPNGGKVIYITAEQLRKLQYSRNELER